MIKALIAEDSRLFREYLSHILESAGNFSIIGIAENGKEAVSLAKERDPDVIIMDIHMPVMDGFEATRRIMESTPKPIVVVSASWNSDDVEKTFMALQAGALAVLEKPRWSNAEIAIKELLDTIRLMSEVPVVRRVPRSAAISRAADVQPPVGVGEGPATVGIVAIGASTGGPPALQQILSSLPGDFPLPILIVQHICEGFLPGMVQWLSESTPLSIVQGANGELIQPGKVYIAPDRLQMGVTESGLISLSESPERNGVIPSASHLFESVAHAYGKRAVGVLLTGMGKDGAEELKLIKDSGGVAIAQDEETSVVFGMPGEAVRLGAATNVLPIENIAEHLVHLAKRASTTVRR